MSDRSLFQAILDDPADDARRLVYADWLDEHDQPKRAELIRVQVELARSGAEPGPYSGSRAEDPVHPGLEARERALLEAHGRHWAEPLRGLADEWAFRRGFIECVGVSDSLHPFLARIREVFT